MYGVGFIAATAMLHLLGLGAGLIARQSRSEWLFRYAGVALFLCGIYLIVPA